LDADPALVELLREQSKNRKVVYLSLGTLVLPDIDFLRELSQRFKNRPDLFLLISLGAKNHPEKLGILPENVTARFFVPQVDIFPYVSLFITHGGNNSLTESLTVAGCPLIVVSHFGKSNFYLLPTFLSQFFLI
jgi:UDP:flavonoid glycosyltransferase YjiC (YdhE family)